MEQEKVLEQIYNKHRIRYKENPDSKQFCCMWSTNDPPDSLEGTEPICDIEEVFDVKISEDEAVKLYDMTLNEATNYIRQLKDT